MANSSSNSGDFIFKTGIFAVLAGLAFWIFNRSGSTEPGTGQPAQNPTPPPVEKRSERPPLPDYLPAGTKGELVQHQYFTLAYSEDHEQAEWVAYELTRSRLNDNWADRTGIAFKPDPLVRTESATPRDYTGSGYDRGHLCAAADMSFDTLALSETFFMSNISPQIRGFNAGIWREMEELTRDWARRYQQLYVVTGPMLNRPGIAQIGFSKVTVPVGYFKVMYAASENKAIGFVVPNQPTEKHVMDYAFDLDYIERMTGLDFFPNLPEGEEEQVESRFSRADWPVSESRYKLRITKWIK